MLFESRGGELLVELKDCVAQVPVGTGKDEEAIHVLHVSDAWIGGEILIGHVLVESSAPGGPFRGDSKFSTVTKGTSR
ncbi:hypothetical protein FPJ27_37265 (plasmid) [Burkholderia sp. MS455]|uniref:hypothetical protein n=1 Tax=Burkholderia sp. MS455 TaxID=2811788 RepID=UPI0019578EBD|nr:hypothetical protein [Burkholderia sp. MS455]QRR11847.1 hypothetical protein FPJ27_37265 [Burkholderia sp. MS455]